MKIKNHCLEHAISINSPNQSARPKGETVSLLVIHNISLPPGQFGGTYIDDLFCNQLDCTAHEFFEEIKELKVSAHVLIRRSGEVTQYVPFDQKAWHAGNSSFLGRAECNDFSIGVELEGTDCESFTDEQYASLAGVSKEILETYTDIKLENIVGHSDIAPGRKTDPGPYFDWGRLRKLLHA